VARAEEPNSRLNVPGRQKRSALPRFKIDRDSFGNFAENFARFMGTAKFLAGMTIVIIVWVLWNTPIVPKALHFDEFPFIFLTLALSLQASYAAPLILLAQNRQADRDKVQIEQDRDREERSIANTEYLVREVAALRLAVNELATRDYVRSELQSMFKEMDEVRSSLGIQARTRDGAPSNGA
jgi:uncharacterized membrane protein